ncbi:MAG: sodium:proton antiporter, partial [Methylocella sp.]
LGLAPKHLLVRRVGLGDGAPSGPGRSPPCSGTPAPAGVNMPGFFPYMIWSGAILLPVFVAVTWLFLM